MICAIPVIDYANPVLNNSGELSLNRDGIYYMEVTNKGLISLKDSVTLFETSDGREFRGKFALDFWQIWFAPTDYRRAEGRRFLARVDYTTGVLPVVTLVKSVD
jgi:hypothetical protein